MEHARARGGSNGEGKHIGSKRVVFTDVCVSRTAAAWSSGMILGYGGGGVRASQQLFAVRPRLSRACGLWRHVIRAGSCAVTWPNAALQRGGSRKVCAEVVSGTMLARRNFASVLRSSARSLACRSFVAASRVPNRRSRRRSVADCARESARCLRECGHAGGSPVCGFWFSENQFNVNLAPRRGPLCASQVPRH